MFWIWLGSPSSHLSEVCLRAGRVPFVHGQHAEVEVDPVGSDHGRPELQEPPEPEPGGGPEPRRTRLLYDGRRVEQRLLMVGGQLQSSVQVGQSLSLPTLLQVHDTQLTETGGGSEDTSEQELRSICKDERGRW